MSPALPHNGAVVLWGQGPPPVGGVARSIEQLGQWLEPQCTVAYGNLTKPRSVVGSDLRSVARKSTTTHIFNVSSPRAVTTYAGLTFLLRGTTVAYLHGGQFAESLASEGASASTALRSLARFDVVWATSIPVADLVTGRSGIPVGVVSPYVGLPTATTSFDVPPARSGGLVAVGKGLALYGIDVALEAGELIREEDNSWRLTVLIYGEETDEAASLRIRLAKIPWVDVVDETDDEGVAALLESAAVLLRPTHFDGDSLLVRMALDFGVRVVASDVSPRPRGVETANLDGSSFAEAVLGSGEMSNGDEMGIPVVDALEAARTAS